MSTWQVFSDDGSNFKWQCTHTKPSIEPQRPLIEKPSSPHHLPSISDLLLQGYANLHEDQKVEIKTPPTFRTGSGRPVAVKQSSLAKASTILGQHDTGADADTEFSRVVDNSEGVGSPFTFRTGSGKHVAIKQSSMAKALSIFGGKDDDAFVDTECFKVHEDNNEKAFSLLGDLDDDAFSAGGDSGIGCMFKTGSGKAVNICSTGLIKARTLLGLEEDSVIDMASKSLQQSRTNLGFQEARPVPNANFNYHPGCEINDRRPPPPPPIKFQTAGGRSIKVSGHALKQARSLLGDPDLGNCFKDGDAIFSSNTNKENNNGLTSFSDYIPKTKPKQMSMSFISPFRSASYDNKTAVRSEGIGLKSNLIKEFDAVEPMPSNRPLVDISNTFGADNKQFTGEKRKLSSRKYPSPFKKPRNSKFIPPLTNKSTLVSSGAGSIILEVSCCKSRASTRYPFQFPRKYIKEYLGEPPFLQKMFKNLPGWLRMINAENANQHMFEDESGSKCRGLDSFFHMLAQCGCSTISKEWITNHYRWIIWKLACYERCYPAKFYGKLLTASNVLEELKYRYEREVNNGHRSALKRILEGDAPPSSPVVLCIASIQLICNQEPDTETSNAAQSSSLELTDGWYSVKALLDELLLKQLASRKLFVGQKLKICGASLSGWNAPVSPLEASGMISLCLHINGTYRAHWADRLGFCKGGCAPLAFKCIKGSGGVVPSTLVGVTRIYPLLYRERLSDGGFVVRSERMESKRVQLYDQRRSSVMEGIMAEFQSGEKKGGFQIEDDEGEKISKLLEEAAEPEVIMADMSLEQLSSFASYQAKMEATRQSEMTKLIEKALEEAGLGKREVNTLMRVRVVGLTSKSSIQKSSTRQGLITIWNPTEKQQSELVEGQAYAVAGLTPINSDTNTIYLRARGSTTKWQPLSALTVEHYQPFFSPRKAVSLLKMGEVPLSSEFDVAACVIYVGKVHASYQQKKQWVFVADGSVSPHPHELSDALLAISFNSPSVDCDSIVPINYNLVGSTVGFCNLIKCAKDHKNHIWVAEATDNSTYFLSYDGPGSKHLKHAATSVDQWAKTSTPMIEKLKKKVSSIVAGKV